MRIVLAYSGGLETSVAIPWLAEKYQAEIVTVTMDLGQGKELDDVRERALASGALRAHVIDLREEFARDFILPALQAGAVYEGRYPLATALGRPLIAKHLVHLANVEGATAIAHGSTGQGNDQVRMDVSAHALDPSLTYFFLPFDASRYEYREPGTHKLRISHAPRNRFFKGTEQVIAAVERARAKVDLEFDLIEGVTHEEAIRRKRASNLVIDHVGEAGGTTGYGMNSLEALAMGIPCMTSMMDAYQTFLGDHPFLVTTPETLEAQLCELARNPQALLERSRRGREWVERVHGADRIVEKIYATYRDKGWMETEERRTNQR